MDSHNFVLFVWEDEMKRQGRGRECVWSCCLVFFLCLFFFMFYFLFFFIFIFICNNYFYFIFFRRIYLFLIL